MIVKVELTLDVPQSADLDTSHIPSALTLDGSLASGVAVICLTAVKGLDDELADVTPPPRLGRTTFTSARPLGIEVARAHQKPVSSIDEAGF
jgi:hypothetical protein